MSSPKILVIVPHTGSVHEGLISACMHATKHPYGVLPGGFACLTMNFNRLWCAALNGRKRHGWTHVAMCHSDIAPQPGWVDTLLAEAESTGADVVSTVVPIKSEKGLTSTGIGRPNSWAVRRLTMTEVYGLPETFSVRDVEPDAEPGTYLAINTGLWIADITRPWVEQFPGFTVEDAISRDPDTGEFHAAFFPEDWGFGWWLADEGLKAVATRKVGVIHTGYKGYRNDHAWGTQTTDEAYHQLGIEAAEKYAAEPDRKRVG